MAPRDKDEIIRAGSLIDLKSRCHAVYDGAVNKANISQTKLTNGVPLISKMGRRHTNGDIYRKDDTNGEVFDNLKAATVY